MYELKGSGKRFSFAINAAIIAFLLALLPSILGYLINAMGWKLAGISGVDLSYGSAQGSFDLIGISNQDRLLTYLSGASITTILTVILLMPVLLGSLVVYINRSSVQTGADARNMGIFSGTVMAFFLFAIFFVKMVCELVYSDVVYRNATVIQSIQEQIKVFLLDPGLLLILLAFFIIALIIIVPLAVFGAHICRKGLIKEGGVENVKKMPSSMIALVFMATLVLVGCLSAIVAFMNHDYLYLPLTYFSQLILFIPLSWAGVCASTRIKMAMVVLLVAISLIVLKVMPPVQLL